MRVISIFIEKVSLVSHLIIIKKKKKYDLDHHVENTSLTSKLLCRALYKSFSGELPNWGIVESSRLLSDTRTLNC